MDANHCVLVQGLAAVHKKIDHPVQQQWRIVPRPRGILTSDDREFLRGEREEISDRAAREKKVRIRQRVRNAFLDFSLLKESLDENDLGLIFNPSRANESREEVNRGIVDLLSLCYSGIRKTGRSFERVLEEAITQSEGEDDTHIQNVFVNIIVEYDSGSGKTHEFFKISNEEPNTTEVLNEMSEEYSLSVELIKEWAEEKEENQDS
jgi:hypothetical protein